MSWLRRSGGPPISIFAEPVGEDHAPAPRRVRQFVLGVAYLVFVSVFFWTITGCAFWKVLLGVVIGAHILCGFALTWLILWALYSKNRLGQFSIGSILWGMLFVAAFLAVLRWLVDTARANGRLEPEFEGAFLMFGFWLVIIFVFGINFLAGLTDSLIWMAAFLVRCRPVRRLLRPRVYPPRCEFGPKAPVQPSRTEQPEPASQSTQQLF